MYDFKKTESEILKFWQDSKIFEKSVENRSKSKTFVFFEGPPTANGLPGTHHLLARAFKDLYCRYKTLRGFFVLRKAGWDTHGLPVEIEVEKQLGFKSKKDIENYLPAGRQASIAFFNKKAKESVWKYRKEWEEMTRRMGFWIDIDHPYITYDNGYMESVWSILSQTWKRGLLYEAHKVVPFCVRCGTSLSTHEVAQGYKKIKERSIYIKFKVSAGGGSAFGRKSLKFKNTFILAWTTTPWTLPGNVALAVGRSIKYQVVSIKGKDEQYILAADRADKILNTKYEILNTILGSDLVGLEYEPLFEVEELKSPQSYKVYDADFVSTEEGTGIVHTAVMYGEDDYNLGTKIGLPKFHTVDEQGKFTDAVKELEGMYVKSKATEDVILEKLKVRGFLFKTEDYEHDYPFCWRCESPLLYYAKHSWFIKMSELNKQLLDNNEKINWVPDHVKHGRFGQWLKESKDWNLSRERYWGTPLPVWKCDRCDNVEVIGSIKDLEKNAVGSKNTYYLMRHGSTERNEKSGEIIISSRLETDKYNLTGEGKKEVEEGINQLKNLDDIDIIYTSPFLRSKETAGIAGRIFHKEVAEDKRLGEIAHASNCEDKTHNLCPVSNTRKDFDTKENDGESWNEVRTRVTEFIKEIDEKHKNKKILIIGHGDPIWLLDKIAAGFESREILEMDGAENDWYPRVAEIKKINWRKIPRNELGEPDLHRPFIDQVFIKCKECRSKMKRAPELIDAWFDSGAMPYAQWHYPFSKANFKNQFPADFIVEGIDQTRGWFYTLLAISTMLDLGPAYKNVIALSHVLDEKGKKMSKSKGNVVSPFELMDKVGADVTRWYFYTVNSPGDSKLFSLRDVESKMKGFALTLQNCIRFYELYGDFEPATYSLKPITLLDKWLLSKFNRLVKLVGESLDKYDITPAARAIENFVVEDLSNWWLRRSRKRKESLPLLREVLLELAKILSPFTPFLAEDIHRRLAGKGESVHLTDWPKVNKKYIKDSLEGEMVKIQEVVTGGLAVRKEKQIKVRQPLKSVSVKGKERFRPDLEQLAKEELNVKEISYSEDQENYVELNLDLNPELIEEGLVREVMRQIQDMRKEAGYKLDEEVYGQWRSSDDELKSALNSWGEEIKKDTLLKIFLESEDSKTFEVEKNIQIAPGKEIWIGIKK